MLLHLSFLFIPRQLSSIFNTPSLVGCILFKGRGKDPAEKGYPLSFNLRFYLLRACIIRSLGSRDGGMESLFFSERYDGWMVHIGFMSFTTGESLNVRWGGSTIWYDCTRLDG